MSQDEDKRELEEHKKHPTIAFSDSVNRSMVGDLKALANNGCFTTIITLVLIIIIGGGILILSQCSR